MIAKIIWFTGLSGSGKSTLSLSLTKILLKKKYKIKCIDGDDFRKKNKNNSFSKINILNNNLSIIKYIKGIQNKYDFILVSVISPLLKSRLIAKNLFKEKYFEIFVYCDLKTLESRDTKGLYKKAKKKIIKNLIGYKSKINYQKSKYKKIVIRTHKYKVDKCINMILCKII